MKTYFNWNKYNLDTLDKVTAQRAEIQTFQIKARDKRQFSFANALQVDVDYLGELQNRLIGNLNQD